MLNRGRTALACALSLSMLLGACGGDDDEPEAGADTVAEDTAAESSAPEVEDTTTTAPEVEELSPEAAAEAAQFFGLAENDDGDTVVLASEDGTQWTEISTLELDEGATRILSSSDGRILAHQQSGRGYSTVPYASDDRGTTWTLLEGAPAGVGADVVIVPRATVGGEFFAHVSATGTVYASSDGASWEVAVERGVEFQGTLYGSATELVLVPNASGSEVPTNVFVSTDGREWSEQPISFEGDATALSIAQMVHDGERWIVVDDEGPVWASDGDSLSFSMVGEIEGYGMVESMAATEELVIAVTSSGNHVSQDGGETWTDAYELGGEALRDLSAVHLAP